MTGPAGTRTDGGGRGHRDAASLHFAMIRGREFLPTRRVWRGAEAPWRLPAGSADLDGLEVRLPDGRTTTVEKFLTEAESDAIVVVHRGAIVYERYLHGMQPHDLHIAASVTKSLIGLVASMLIREGALARDDVLRRYVPELAGTAFGDATVQALLHMGTQVRYGGRVFDKETEAQRYFAAVGIRPRPEGYDGPTTIMEHLATARAEGPSSEIFRYENGNTEALGEALRRITGGTLAELVSDRIWSRIGTEEDAHFALDNTRTEIACGRLSATARDLARVGEMLRCGGAAGSRQVIPDDLVAGLTHVPPGAPRDVLGRGDTRGPDGKPIMGYHDYWWIPYDGYGSFAAHGRYGQRLYVAPALELVVAHFGSHLIAPDVPVPAFDPVIRAIGRHLRDGSKP